MTSRGEVFEGEGFVLRALDDRIDVERKKRRQSITYTEIASVTVARRPKRLVVVTLAGKRHEFVMRRDAETARMLVASRLGAE
ncbi:MAG: hypothetical protein ACE5EF_06085 [Dehalococcoidia bacterium]